MSDRIEEIERIEAPWRDIVAGLRKQLSEQRDTIANLKCFYEEKRLLLAARDDEIERLKAAGGVLAGLLAASRSLETVKDCQDMMDAALTQWKEAQS